MDDNSIRLENLTEKNLDAARAIQREDVSEDFVDTVDTIWDITQYGVEHGCLGRSYAIKYQGSYVGIILLGEALDWEPDPPQMRAEPFDRLMGFVIDRRFRGQGLGDRALEQAIREVYREFGVRPIALGCHKDNHSAARFYLRHGFRPVDAMEGSDIYYLRYPQ